MIFDLDIQHFQYMKKNWLPLYAVQFPEPQAACISSQAVIARHVARVRCRRLEMERTMPHGKGEVELEWIWWGPRVGAGWKSRPSWLGLEKGSRSFELKRI